MEENENVNNIVENDPEAKESSDDDSANESMEDEVNFPISRKNFNFASNVYFNYTKN